MVHFTLFIVTIGCMLVFSSNHAFAFDLTENNTFSVAFPKADIIEWRVKVVDGVTYIRQFNFSTNEWIGQWIRV